MFNVSVCLLRFDLVSIGVEDCYYAGDTTKSAKSATPTSNQNPLGNLINFKLLLDTFNV